jgi:hypothetical protein
MQVAAREARLMRAREFMPMVEAIPVKPQKPLTPHQAQKRSDKLAKTQQQVSDENVRHTNKIRDLRSRIP